MENQNDVSFKWSNYFRPTPKNIQMLIEGVKGLLATISVASYFEGRPELAFWIMFCGALFDQASRFLAHVQELEAKKQIVVEVPADTEVKITEETRPADEK